MLEGLLWLYGVIVVGIVIAQRIAMPRAGWLALSQVFAPYLFAPLLIGLPLVLLQRARLLRSTLVICSVVFMLAFVVPVRWAVPPATASTPTLKVMSWNVKRRPNETQTQRICAALATATADVVTLIEVNYDEVQCAPAVSRRFPYRFSRGGTSGEILLLSRYPLRELPVKIDHAAQRAHATIVDVQIGADQIVTVIGAHMPAPNTVVRRRSACQSAVCYDPSRRDAAIRQLHALATDLIRQGRAVILAGDFNLTEREPAYRDLVQGLTDAQRAAGGGVGHTWGVPSGLQTLLPLLRIDYQFSSLDIQATRTTTDCTMRGSDHCILQTDFSIP